MLKSIDDLMSTLLFAERKAGGETEVGVPAAWQTAQRHHAGVSRRLCAGDHRETTGGCYLRALQSRPEGQDAPDRLSTAGGQSVATGSGHGHPF